MLEERPAIFSNARSIRTGVFALFASLASMSLSGCALWFYDDPCCAPSLSAPAYVVPEPVPTVYPHYEAPEVYYEPGVYYYAPDAIILGQSPETSSVSSSASYLTRGQDDSFPTFDASFPTLDEPTSPPSTSEVSDFVQNGTSVPEPTGQYETIDYDDESFRPQPKRESLAEREKTEEKINKNFETWLREKKANRQKSSSKSKRYLQPIRESEVEELFNREPLDSKDKDSGIIQTVTLAGFEQMLENEESRRELYDWEKEEPLPIDWSKYAMSLDNIRAWFGMGPNERVALEYMRQACEKQKEYSKTRDTECLREAAQLYEKAASRWPGPALRPDYARKHPYDAPKSGTLIEEDGIFFAGECWFFCREFRRALTCYKALVSTYNSSIYKATAMKRLYYIGCYWMECSEESSVPSVNLKDSDKPRFNSFAGAEKAFSTIFLNDASDSGLAADALFALANGYMRRGVNQGDGSFDSAARYYKQLYEFYPGDKHAEDACRLAMIALHKSYQGVFYDDAPLNEARQLAETILRSGRGNMDVIYEELDNIKEEQAHRLFALGGYYEKRGSFASARTYYNRLVKEYPNSCYAVEAAQRYEAIEDKPAEADQLAWIRPVMPFLPQSKKEFFEDAPHSELSRVARRDDALNALGKTSEEDKETKVAETPSETKRY